jgi:hypothetical protein
LKISFRTQGTGSYTTLADDTAGTLITGFVPRLAGLAQVTPLFRAANAQVLARNNRSWQISGTVETASATAAAAADFIRSQAAAIPDFVDLKIEQDATALLLTPAVFVGFDPIINGVSTRITYTFVGANLITAP